MSGAQSPFVRRSNEEPIRISHTRQHRPYLKRIMFWGAMCGDGPVALLPISGTMTAGKYIQTLNENLVPWMENQPLNVKYTFHQDNAPSHKAQQTTTFLQDNSINILGGWPPYSPDLNVIENLWAHLKYVVRKENVGSKEHLQARIMEVWNSQETKNVCRRLADSMPKRIKLCI